MINIVKTVYRDDLFKDGTNWSSQPNGWIKVIFENDDICNFYNYNGIVLIYGNNNLFYGNKIGHFLNLGADKSYSEKETLKLISKFHKIVAFI